LSYSGTLTMKVNVAIRLH